MKHSLAFNKYKDVATKLFLELETSGVICPLIGCGDAMLGVPSIEEELIITCIHCNREFCRVRQYQEKYSMIDFI